jgi:eukaryotic-like serine/threonine-protein kinase
MHDPGHLLACGIRTLTSYRYRFGGSDRYPANNDIWSCDQVWPYTLQWNVESPTLTFGATEVGVILGTAAYIPPEQAKGKSVDKRADIWAFGVVFYELLTGERLFKGEDVSDTLAQVLTKEPDLDQVPPKARKLLGRCLEKDPKKRLRDIGEAAYLLDAASVTAPSASRRGWAGWGVAGLAIGRAVQNPAGRTRRTRFSGGTTTQ